MGTKDTQGAASEAPATPLPGPQELKLEQGPYDVVHTTTPPSIFRSYTIPVTDDLHSTL